MALWPVTLGSFAWRTQACDAGGTAGKDRGNQGAWSDLPGV